MSVQFDGVPPVGPDGTNVTLTTGVAAIGGGVGVRIIIDDAVVTSELQAHLIITALEDAISRNTWPVA